MSLYEDIKNRKNTISVVGLGYVGLPLAIEFAKIVDVIGYDVNSGKINKYKEFTDVTNEVGSQALENTAMTFTYNESDLKKARFHIIAVPTPINEDRTPDLKPVIGASQVVGRNLIKGSIVVYESTVYPGVTEEVCVPIIEKLSGLKCGQDFKVGYSPERINPGDKVHTVTKITKIVSGMDEDALEEIANVYSLIVKAGVYRAESIKVAEAAKVIENSQRDINIAFMNELSVIFNKMGIDTKAVLKAAGTKWNFLNFTPGLVGGHCIGVDPYYLTYKAEQMGYHPQVILAGRRINDSMGKYVAENTVKQLIKADKQIKGARVLIMGFTFKENVPDVRNTRAIDIINELREYGVDIYVCDPIADKTDALHEYNISFVDFNSVEDFDAIILAVSHSTFNEIGVEKIKTKYRDGKYVFIDVKSMFDKCVMKAEGFIYWSL